MTDKDYEIAWLKLRNAQLHHTVRALIDRLQGSWERRDLAPDSDLEAISAAEATLAIDEAAE